MQGDYRITFGKYKGYKISTIKAIDNDYYLWLQKTNYI